MAAKTEAQEEFDSIIEKAASTPIPSLNHPADAQDYHHDAEHHDDLAEEETDRQQRIDENMRMPSLDPRGGPMFLPHRDFDSSRTTGVKGVIADARSFEAARKQSGNSWRPRGKSPSNRLANGNEQDKRMTFFEDADSDDEQDEFVERWREQRRAELQKKGNDIRNRRTSPSTRRYGRFDEVDASGYLDAIEKVTRDTVVCVFVYDPECPVSQIISDALEPLVSKNPSIHFVRVHYEVIEFDNAGVPAILAYKNQGDLFANLTYIIDQIPEDTLFDTRALETILQKHQVL